MHLLASRIWPMQSVLLACIIIRTVSARTHVPRATETQNPTGTTNMADTGAPAFPQSLVVFLDPRSFAVQGSDGKFRNTTSQFLNPTNNQPPFFQIFDRAFLDLLGEDPSIHEIASNPTFAFAHEAPIYNPPTDEVFFASNAGGALGRSDIDHNNQVSKISLKEAEEALNALKPNRTTVNVKVTPLKLPPSIQMTNGGTGPYNGQLVFVNSGRGNLPPNLVFVDPNPPATSPQSTGSSSSSSTRPSASPAAQRNGNSDPNTSQGQDSTDPRQASTSQIPGYTTTVLLDNYFGRQFNSLNDVKIHPGNRWIYFTDVSYGYINRFRPAPMLPNQVYAFNPNTSAVKVVATDFDKVNGIAFSPDGGRAYLSDTGTGGGLPTAAATLYAYDILPLESGHGGVLENRRVFAFVDAGIPDGVQVDEGGNVWTGCGDGVHIFSPSGTLLGKIFTGSTAAQMVFAGDGRVVVLAETKVYLVRMRGVKEGKVRWP